MASKTKDVFEHQRFTRSLFNGLIKAHFYFRESINNPGYLELNPETTRFELNPENKYEKYNNLISLLKKRNEAAEVGSWDEFKHLRENIEIFFTYSRLVFNKDEKATDVSEIPQHQYLYFMSFITHNIESPEENPGRVIVDMDNRPLNLNIDQPLNLYGLDPLDTITRFYGSEPNTLLVPFFELRYFKKPTDIDKWMEVVNLELKLHGLLPHLGKSVRKESLYEPAVKFYLNAFEIAFSESKEINFYKKKVGARKIARHITIKKYPEAKHDTFRKIIMPRLVDLIKTLSDTPQKENFR